MADQTLHKSAATAWLRNTLRLLAAIITTIAIGLLLMVLAGYFRPKVETAEPTTQANNGGDQADGEWVDVAKVTIPRFESATGTIRPVHETTIASRLLARVTEVNVTAGQAVAQGEVLMRLDDSDLTARLQQAEAAVATAEAVTKRTQADFERAKLLVERNNISRAEFDATQAAMSTAASELQRAQQNVAEMRVVVEFATIRSPMDGTVIEKSVDVGDTVSPGTAMLTIYDPGHMQMIATVRESLALRLQVGQYVPAMLESLDITCQAKISEIVPEAQAASRSFQVKVTGPCPAGAYSGMFGRIMLPVGNEDLLLIPANSVRRVGQLAFVQLQVDGQMQRRSIQVGREIDGNVEVLSGLSEGEKVLLPRQYTEGQ